MSALVIANTQIRQDAAGRYCLNDLHQASGGESRHRPGRWLDSDKTRELIAAVEADNPEVVAGKTATVPAVATLQGGVVQGTYAAKELVYGYAMWISAAFHLHVIRAYDAMVRGEREAATMPRLPESPPHRADVLVAASRAFGALVRAGRTLRMSHARSLRAANAATMRATGVDLLDELGACDLAQDGDQPLLGAGDDWQVEIEAFISGRSEVSARQILREALDADPDDRALLTRVGTLLTRLGWQRFRRRAPIAGGESGYFYRPPFADLQL